MALQKKVKIIFNKPLAKNYFRLRFEWPQLAKESKPGQFIQVRISESFEPLLRRPFGIHRVSGGAVEILYQIVGQGTKMLSQKNTGDYLNVLGPLGNGFKISTPHTLNATRCILVAGGMGVAPLTFLAEKLTKRKTKNEKGKTLVLIGAKTQNHILCADEFKRIGCEIKIATDDGSAGFKGYVSELLNKLLSTIDCWPSTIYACGPKPMLKEIQKICAAKKLSCQASFEENIACGLGACLGCAIKTMKGFKKVCFDGPVFEIKEVVF